LPRRGAADGDEPPPEMPFGQRARHGVTLFVHTRELRPVLALNLAVAAAGAFVLVQTVVIARSTFAQGEDVVALLLAAVGAGSIGAAVLLPSLLRRVPERRVMLSGAVLLTAATAGVPLALRASTPKVGILAIAALWVVVGAGWSATETPVGRIIRRAVPREDLPAAFAAQFSLSHACWLLTYPLAGWLGSAGLAAAAIVLAVIAGGATVTAALAWPHDDARPATAVSEGAVVPS
jgi:MFS family permease